MKRIVRLTESDLTRIVRKVILENENKDPRFVSCGELGVKYAGLCEKKTKQPVEYCSKLGVKTTGYCYVSTNKPVPK